MITLSAPTAWWASTDLWTMVGGIAVAVAAEDTWLGGWPTAAATLLLWAIPVAIGFLLDREAS
jgi:hypothetical protein